MVLVLQLVQLRGGRGVVRRRRGPVGVMHHRGRRDANRRGRRSRAGRSTATGPRAATTAATMAPRRRRHGHLASPACQMNAAAIGRLV